MKNECKNCDATYFVNGKPCQICNKGTKAPKKPLSVKSIKEYWKAFWYWWGPW